VGVDEVLLHSRQGSEGFASMADVDVLRQLLSLQGGAGNAAVSLWDPSRGRELPGETSRPARLLRSPRGAFGVQPRNRSTR
jgi:hypothetical protein